MSRKTNRFAIFWIVLTFLAGYMVGAMGNSIAEENTEAYSKLDIFAKVLHYVETNYVDPVERDNLIYGAIKGMLDTLDPHTIFMPPDVFREMKIDTTGEFQGLGVIVEIRDRRLTVISPIEGSPAHKAGLQRDDVIMAVDGKDTLDMSLQEAVALMRGPVGSTVVLIILRSGKELTVSIIRDRIHVASVEARPLGKGIGYVHVKSFQDRTAQQMTQALKKLQIESDQPLTGLVLDLRGNPGGLLEEAVRMVDEFVTDGLIVSTEGRNGAHVEVARAHPSGAFLETKLVVLIDSRSASAAEIVAGALQDKSRALIFGTTSYGKGSVQNIIDLDDGSGLKITVARYFTPNRRSIEAVGIHPDVVVANPEELAQFTAEQNVNGGSAIAPEVTDTTGQKLLQMVQGAQNVEPGDHPLRAAVAYLRVGKLPE